MFALHRLYVFVAIALLLLVAAPGPAAEASGDAVDGIGQGQAVIVTMNMLPSGFIGAAPPIDVTLWQVGGRSTIARGQRFREANAVKVNAAYSRLMVRAGAFRLQPTRPRRLMANQQYCLIVTGVQPLLVAVGPAKATLQQAKNDWRCKVLLNKFTVYAGG